MIQNHGFPKEPSNQSQIPAALFDELNDWIHAHESKTLWITSDSQSNAATSALSYLLPLLFPSSTILLAFKYGNHGEGGVTACSNMVQTLLQQVYQQITNTATSQVSPLSYEGEALGDLAGNLLQLESIVQRLDVGAGSVITVIFDGLDCMDTDLNHLFKIIQSLHNSTTLKLLIVTSQNSQTLERSINQPTKIHVHSDSMLDYPLSSLDIPDPISKAINFKRNNHLNPEDSNIGQLFDDQEADQKVLVNAQGWFQKHKDVLDFLDRARPSWCLLGGGVKIAILDTGLDKDCPYLEDLDEDRLVYWSLVEDEQHQVKSDTCGHGTRVASLLYRICPYAKFYIYKISHDYSCTQEAAQNAAKAIHWAAKQGVQIVSMSFGFPNQVDCLADALANHARQVIFFAAAANGGANNDVAYPASADEVICIAASDGYGNFSNFNPNGCASHKTYSTLGEGIALNFPESNNGKALSGTSYAAPIAAGIAGLLITFCTFYFEELSIENGESLLRRLRRKRGMQMALDLLTKDERLLTSRYIYPPKRFGYKFSESEVAFKHCKRFANAIADELEKI